MGFGGRSQKPVVGSRSSGSDQQHSLVSDKSDHAFYTFQSRDGGTATIPEDGNAPAGAAVPPPARSSGTKDLDVMAVRGASQTSFNFRTLSWSDTVVKNPIADPEAQDLQPKLPWQGRKWFMNLRPLAVPVVLAYAVGCIVYVIIRARFSLNVNAGVEGVSEGEKAGGLAYAIIVLLSEVLGMVSLSMAAINHIYKVDWKTKPFIPKDHKKFRVRVLIPCYMEDIDVLHLTVRRAVAALHVAADCIEEAAVYLCDDAPDKDAYGQPLPYNAQRSAMLGLGEDADGSVRNLARGKKGSSLYHKVKVIHQNRKKTEGSIEGLVNSKATNVNHCVNRIRQDWEAKKGTKFNWDNMEILAILDADQAIVDLDEDGAIINEFVEMPMRPRQSLAFFKDLLPYFVSDPKVAIVQSPQVFKGLTLGMDVLNHRNIDFWNHQQPAYNLRKFISCAGTNFLIRADAFIEAGMFPKHTLTEDFALGKELMGCGYYGAYVERAYVLGDAPDVLRTAVAQRSRWCKGAYQMLFSVRGTKSLFKLFPNFRLMWMFLFPCYNYFVSGLTTPIFMLIPVIFIWAGAFPAKLTGGVIAAMVVYFVLSATVQYFPRFDRKQVLRDVLAHWNADVATKNFWFMFLKSGLNGALSKFNEGNVKWKSGSDKEADGIKDIIPHILFLVIYFITFIWGIIMLVAGADFVGPLGISLLWIIYHAQLPGLLIWYRILKMRHEPEYKEKMTERQMVAASNAHRRKRNIFTALNVGALLSAVVLTIAILVLAIATGDEQFSRKSTGYLSPKRVAEELGWTDPPTPPATPNGA